METGEPRELGIARQCIAQRHRAMDGQVADETVGQRLGAVIVVFFVQMRDLASSVDGIVMCHRIDRGALGIDAGARDRLILGPDIAAFGPQTAGAVDADEGARDRIVLGLEPDGPVLQRFHRRFDLSKAFIDLLGQFIRFGVVLLELFVFSLERGVLWLQFTQQKGRKRNPVSLETLIIAELRRCLAEEPVSDKTFLLNGYGKPFTAAGFGDRFRK
ncbi:hypothetical protein [uncultured Roseobacter sp.]|uniref:hypothetical protein n=1 Tax=uncultured Roseobacter sp. TaxID=114847 RepID=UPI00263035FB|nr:hypothetical protein [uncultured Roseobacter sp.]